VAGALASDTICDQIPLDDTFDPISPSLYTSNPSTISQSAGGVGRNVAVAAHLAGAEVALASVVADDLAGESLLEHIETVGLSTKHIRRLSKASGARTAQYVAVNDTKKDLVLAMADMSILARPDLGSPDYWIATMRENKPKWVVVDGNWSPGIISSIIDAARSCKAPIAFEPVSAVKAARLFHKANLSVSTSSVVPDHAVHLAAPNAIELTAMWDAASNASLFESDRWWDVIDNFGMASTGSRERLISITSRELVDQGLPQQCLQLLPFIPNMVTKLGRQGCLLATLLRRGDERLTRPDCAPYIIARNMSSSTDISGVYMRLFPPSREILQDEVISVNGVGDTLLGVILAGLVKGKSLEQVIPIAQDAAVLTLKSAEAVSSEVQSLRPRLTRML